MEKEVLEKEIKEVIEKDFYKNQLLKAFANSNSEQLKDLHDYFILKNHTPTAERFINDMENKKWRFYFCDIYIYI